MFAVRGDSPATSIRDLVGRSVAFGARGSGLVLLSRYVLDGMVLDGRAAALWGGDTGWPGFTAIAQAGTNSC
jgi:uncharacterized protein